MLTSIYCIKRLNEIVEWDQEVSVANLCGNDNMAEIQSHDYYFFYELQFYKKSSRETYLNFSWVRCASTSESSNAW